MVTLTDVFTEDQIKRLKCLDICGQEAETRSDCEIPMDYPVERGGSEDNFLIKYAKIL